MIECAVLYSDGGSRNNPGEAGIGFVLSECALEQGAHVQGESEDLQEKSGRVFLSGGAYIGVASNNVAEYSALIWGIQNAATLGVRNLRLRADSELMIRQVTGEYKVKNESLKPLHDRAMNLLLGFESYQAEHIERALNAAADSLANQAMDARASVGNFAVSYEPVGLFGYAQPMAQVDAVPDVDVSAMGTASVEAVVLPKVACVADVATSTTVNATEVVPNAVPNTDVSAPEAAFSTAVNAPGVVPEAVPKTAVSMQDSPQKLGTYTLWIKEHFDAAHALVGYPGQCRNLHGHTWDVEVSVKGTKLDSVGIVYDFKDLKDNLMTIMNKYDHKYLNEIAPFDRINATAEILTRVIYEQMEELLPEHIELIEIGVWESPIAKLTYRKQS